MQINGTSERLTLRLIDPNDYTVHEDNRIRYAKERSPGLWLRHVRPHQHSRPAIRHTNTLDEAKAWFKAAWLAFKDKHGPEKMANASMIMLRAIRNNPAYPGNV